MSTRGLYVLVKVLSVHRNYAFPCCIRCSTRIRTEHNENIFVCSKCQQKYDKKEISYRYRMNMTVSDRTQVSNVTVFGQCLEHFFGASATHLKRFIEDLNLDKEEFPLPVDQLVHQCIEQCFIGSMIRLCFRGLHPCQTDSQASRSSPTHLKNILTKMCEANMNFLPKTRKNSSHLIASYISRPESTEKNATVFELLKEYLEFFKSSKSVTPSCSLTSGPHSMSYSSLMHNTSLQNNSRIYYACSRRKISEDLNFLVSPLVLSYEARGSSQSPATGLSNLNRKVDLPLQIDSESQTSVQNSPILNESPNRTALILVSLLNMDTGHECIDELSSDPTSDTDTIQKNLACFEGQAFIGKPTNARDAIEIENQELKSSFSCPGKDPSAMNDQEDMDLFLEEDLSSFFDNLSLDSDWERSEITGENSQNAKGETFFADDDQPRDRQEASRELQPHLKSGCNILQENPDQITSLFPEDMLTDVEFSDISFPYDYETLHEPHPSTCKPSPMTSSQDSMKLGNEDFSCAMISPGVERASSHGKSSSKSNYREVPERLIMETEGENGCRHSDSLRSCYFSSDKSLHQEGFRSLGVDTPTHLSFQSRAEHTSTPVLFDDSSTSTESRSKLYRSLALPEALHSADAIERGINIHSTPLNSECQRKFDSLSRDLQSYSGVFVDVRNRDNYVGSTKALDIKRVDNCPTPRRVLKNEEYLHVLSSACNRMEERDEDRGDQNCTERFSFQNKMSPTAVAGQSRLHTSDQICPESPLLFSFSSVENSDIQQDSLLCASLLECSYLK